MRRLRVLLDTNVLVDAQVRDLCFTLAEQGDLDIVWTDQLLGELAHTLTVAMGRSRTQADRLCRAIRAAFPESRVVGFEPLAAPDPNDAHVLGAAVAAEADLLVTHDRPGFPDDEILGQWDLEVVGPDDGLVEIISAVGLARVAVTFASITERLQTPPLALAHQLERLEKSAPQAALLISAALGDPVAAQMLDDWALAEDEANPRAAVWALVQALAARDPKAVDESLRIAARADFGAATDDRLERLTSLLGEVVDEPDAWGIGTAHRPLGVDREVVALVRRADNSDVRSAEGPDQCVPLHARTRRWSLADRAD